MALNLRAKIPKSDNLIIYDLNQEALKSLVVDTKGFDVEVVDNPRDVAHRSVRIYKPLIY